MGIEYICSNRYLTFEHTHTYNEMFSNPSPLTWIPSSSWQWFLCLLFLVTHLYCQNSAQEEYLELCVWVGEGRGVSGDEGTRVSYNKQLNSLTAIGSVARFNSLLLPILTLHMHTTYMHYVLWAIIAVPTYLCTSLFSALVCYSCHEVLTNWKRSHQGRTQRLCAMVKQNKCKMCQLQMDFGWAGDWQGPCLTWATPEYHGITLWM